MSKIEQNQRIIYKKTEDLIPYANNPRINDKAVDLVANSIREFGFRSPIIVDKYNVIVCGHTRLKAAKKLGLGEVPCVVADDLTDEQIKAYRIADNMVAEAAEWDEELLKSEIEGLPFDFADFGFEENETKLDDDKYKSVVPSPVYEIKSECPPISDLVNTAKAEVLKNDILALDVPQETKDFLLIAAERFNVFNYAKVAEFFAHQEKAVQECMEKLALVIVDYNKAIENGFCRFSLEMKEFLTDEDEEIEQ